MARWRRGEQTVRYLIGRGRLEALNPQISPAWLRIAGVKMLLAGSPPERFR